MGLTKERARHTFIGTVSFMAPEVIEQDTGYDFKADIWSFGITVLELITGAAPFHKFPPLKVLMMTLQNDPPSLESVSEYEDQYKSYGKSIRKLIIDCLQKDPTKRPTASELLKHPFIKKAKDRRYLMQTLLPSTPSFSERSRRALDGKRGLCFNSENNGGSGSWVWPPEDTDPRSNVMFADSAEVLNHEGSHSSGSGSGSGSGSSTTDGLGLDAKGTFEENNAGINNQAIHIEQKLNLEQNTKCDEARDKQPKQVNDCTQLLK